MGQKALSLANGRVGRDLNISGASVLLAVKKSHPQIKFSVLLSII